MTDPTPVKAVVFDIGRVLIQWEPESFYDALIGENRRKALFAEVPLEETNLNVDRGAEMKASMYGLAEQYPHWSAEIRHWHDSWLKMASPDIPHSARLLRALRAKGLRVLALSNFGRETFDIACKAYPVLTEFDMAYVSAHLGCIKPEPEIYAHLETQEGLSGAALLFADDRPENIEAAAARGWRTHLFTQPQGFADRLVAEGLLNEEEAA